jgi:hypothetical protein
MEIQIRSQVGSMNEAIALMVDRIFHDATVAAIVLLDRVCKETEKSTND